MAEKLVYQVDYRQYEQMLKTIVEMGKQAGLTEKEIDELAKTSEQSLKGVNKETSKMPGGFGKVTSAVKGVGVAMVASFAIDILLDFGKELLNIEREFTKLRGQVQRFSGATGKELDTLTAKTKALSNTFGKDLNDVLTSANAFAKQTGISFTEALELIEKGFLNGADSGDEFLSKIREYPVQFREAGFTAEEFIKIATQEATSGIYSDKLLDTIKELGLSLRELTKAQQDALKNAFGEQFTNEFARQIRSGAITTKEAFFLIAEEANRIGLNVQQTQTLTADLFKGAGEDAGGFEEVIKQVNQALEQNLDNFDALGQKQSETLKIQEDYNAELNKLSKNIEGAGNALSNFWTQSLTIGAEAINQLILFFDIGNAKARSFAENVATGFEELSDEEIVKNIESANKQIEKLNENIQFIEGRGFGDQVSAFFKGGEKETVSFQEGQIAFQEELLNKLKEEQERRALINQQQEEAKRAEEERIKLLNSSIAINTKKIDQAEKTKAIRKEEVEIVEGLRNNIEDLISVQEGEVSNLEDIIDMRNRQQQEAIRRGQEAFMKQLDDIQLASEILGNEAINLGQAIGGGFGEFISGAGQVIKTLQSIAAAQQAIAIAKQAENPFPANLIAIGATLAAFTQAITTIKSASKFATGTEFLNGPGTGTSDSIPAWLSRGERVVTAKTNADYHESLNMITRGEVSPEQALRALETVQNMSNNTDTSKIPGVGLGFIPATTTDNSAVVEAIKKKNMAVNVNVLHDGIEIIRGKSKEKRLNNRYNFKG